MSKKQDAIQQLAPFVLFAALAGGFWFVVHNLPAPAVVEPAKPAPVEIRKTPVVIPQPAPQPSIVVPKPRTIATEPTADLLTEWNAWRHGPAPRTAEIQAVYEELLKRGVIRRDGEPAEGDYGGRRKIGRRR